MPKGKQIEQLRSESGKTGTQRFEYREISRTQINPAPYNPRAISEYARKQLRSSLDRFGLVEPLVWNETTSNLVSGHQRLSLVDEREGWPDKVADYRIGVSVIRMSLKREKELNVWLNNASAQGHYDKDTLFDLIKSDEFDLGDFGFTKVDLELEFGNLDGLEDMFAAQKAAAASAVDEAEKIAAIKARKKRVREQDKADPSEDASYYVVTMWGSREAKEEWLRQHRLPHDVTHIDIERLATAIRAGAIPGSDARRGPKTAPVA